LKQKILVLGAGGQLGTELLHSARPDVECVALAREELDIGDPLAVAHYLSARAPAVIINAAAYTAVDAAEDNAAAAHRANAQGPANLARSCRELGIRLLHVSTDFVFDGASSRPYMPDAPTAPLGEYGRSKLAGERAVLELCPQALVLRSGWVYSRFGNNFVKTMLRLMVERGQLAVVAVMQLVRICHRHLRGSCGPRPAGKVGADPAHHQQRVPDGGAATCVQRARQDSQLARPGAARCALANSAALHAGGYEGVAG
jgi:dTDP-4-dehydrorhamnose reductase